MTVNWKDISPLLPTSITFQRWWVSLLMGNVVTGNLRFCATDYGLLYPWCKRHIKEKTEVGLLDKSLQNTDKRWWMVVLHWRSWKPSFSCNKTNTTNRFLCAVLNSNQNAVERLNVNKILLIYGCVLTKCEVFTREDWQAFVTVSCLKCKT